MGVDRRLIALDERGLPTLLLPFPSVDAPDLASLDPATPVSSLVVRLPDSSVVDLPPGTGDGSTSPLAPLCAAVPEAQPLCDATSVPPAPGAESPLQPLCDAAPEAPAPEAPQIVSLDAFRRRPARD